MKQIRKAGYKEGVEAEAQRIKTQMKGKYIYFGERSDQLKFLQNVLGYDGSSLGEETLAVKYSTAYILYDHHINVKKMRKKTFSAYYNQARFA